jgi:cephalosporin-C deacetylase-like acetyl esterase
LPGAYTLRIKGDLYVIDTKTEIQEPLKYTVSERPVTFGTKGVKLNGTLFMPSGAKEYARLPGAVMCHGYGGDSVAFENSAKTLASEGVIALTFDFRGQRGYVGRQYC